MLNFYKPQRLAVFALFVLSFLLFTSAQIQSQTGLQFDGSNDYVTFGPAIGTGTGGLGADNFTLECWFMRTGSGTQTNTGTGGIFAIPLITKGRGEADGGIPHEIHCTGKGQDHLLQPLCNGMV